MMRRHVEVAGPHLHGSRRLMGLVDRYNCGRECTLRRRGTLTMFVLGCSYEKRPILKYIGCDRVCSSIDAYFRLEDILKVIERVCNVYGGSKSKRKSMWSDFALWLQIMPLREYYELGGPRHRKVSPSRMCTVSMRTWECCDGVLKVLSCPGVVPAAARLLHLDTPSIPDIWSDNSSTA